MIKTTGMEGLKLIAGEAGLDRIINWVHVSEIPEVVEWVEGGVLLFITGITIQDNVDALLKLVEDINKKKLSGLVINVGPYIKSTPQKVIDLANSVDFPIFELPFSVKLIEITHIIFKEIFTSKIEEESRNSFMNEIILGESAINDEIVDTAIKYGYNAKKDYYAFVISIDNFEEYLKENNIEKEEKIIELKNNVLREMDSAVKDYDTQYMYMTHKDCFYIFIAVDKNKKDIAFFNKIASLISKRVRKNDEKLTVSIGIGEKASTLCEFRNSVLEAKSAIEVAKRLYGKNSIGNYRELGIYKILLELKNEQAMLKVYNEKLGKLINYEKNDAKELLNCLEVYIDENRNIGNAADKLFVHRNTMKYRINKIQEILKCDLKDDNDIFNITLCLKIGKFLGIN